MVLFYREAVHSQSPGWQRAGGEALPRAGFTLVELLVVVGLIVILLAMALFLVPAINTQQQATQAGTQLQQWIEIAKQRAGRDRAPRGIRLLAGSANPLQVTQLEYIEQPPDYFFGNNTNPTVNPTTPGIVSRAVSVPVLNLPAPATYWIKFEMFDPMTGLSTSSFVPPNPVPPQFVLPRNLNAKGAMAAVQPGDHLELGGNIYLIVGIAPKAPLFNTPSTDTLIVTSELNTNVGLQVGYASTQYRIIRQPRPIGDDPLQMPANIIIDLAPRNLGYDLPAPTLDIMFSPDGRVIGPLAAYDKIILWVRDVTVPGAPGDYPPQNDPALVCIYPRTGLIEAWPVDTYLANTSPYTFTTTGRRSSQ